MRTFLIAVLLLSNANLSTTLDGTSVTYKVLKKEQKEVTKKQYHEVVYTTKLNKKIRKKESDGNWTKVSKDTCYIGYYQFGKAALKATGFGYIDPVKFAKDPSIWPPVEQEKAMSRLLKLNKNRLQPFIEKYVGDTIGGTVITESGILAAAHLAGPGDITKKTGVIGFLVSRGNINPMDKNGDSVLKRLREFSEL